MVGIGKRRTCRDGFGKLLQLLCTVNHPSDGVLHHLQTSFHALHCGSQRAVKLLAHGGFRCGSMCMAYTGRSFRQIPNNTHGKQPCMLRTKQRAHTR